MNTPFTISTVTKIFSQVQKTNPMIHHITNNVVMNFTANITLAMGASPVMAPSIAESAQMAGYSGALLLNIGTINPELLKSMVAAGKAANEKNIPIILDPVGAGATELRTKTIKTLLSELKISAVRGNAGEILSLAGTSGKVRGVDSLATGEGFEDIFKTFAAETGIITAVSGETDFITDGTNWIKVHNGNRMMTSITGTGCGATTAVACYAATGSSLLHAVAAGITCYNIAGEIACGLCKGPGSFVPEFIDQLFNLSEETITNVSRIETNL